MTALLTRSNLNERNEDMFLTSPSFCPHSPVHPFLPPGYVGQPYVTYCLSLWWQALAQWWCYCTSFSGMCKIHRLRNEVDRTPSKALVISLRKKRYHHCLVLVWFLNEFMFMYQVLVYMVSTIHYGCYSIVMTYLSSLTVSPWVSRFWQWNHCLTLTT